MQTKTDIKELCATVDEIQRKEAYIILLQKKIDKNKQKYELFYTKNREEHEERLDLLEKLGYGITFNSFLDLITEQKISDSRKQI